MENPEDLDALVAAAKGGSEDAFGALYSRYFDRMYAFLYYRVGHKEQAEDLAEEVFVKAFTGISNFRSPGAAFAGWLYRIAKNLLTDHYRARRQTVALDQVEGVLPQEDLVVDILELEQKQRVLLELLRELTGDQRQVLQLKFFEELSTAEIAQLLDTTEGAVRVTQHRAIKKLKDLLGGKRT